MARRYGKGQSLVETMILLFFSATLLVGLEACHDRTKIQYHGYKVKKSSLVW